MICMVFLLLLFKVLYSLKIHYCSAKLCVLELFGHNIRDVVPRMSVQALLESLLIQEMSDEAHRSAENKYTVQSADLHELVRFFHGEAAAVAQHVDHGETNHAVDVENEIGLLRRRDLLDLEGVVEERRVGKVIFSELSQQNNSHIRIVEL